MEQPESGMESAQGGRARVRRARPEVTRAAGLGATMLAGVAAGEFSDLDEASGAMFHTRDGTPRTLPQSAIAQIRSDYEKVYAHLDEAYREVGLRTYTNGE